MWIGAIGLYARGPARHLTRELRALRESYCHSENAVRLQNQQDTEASEVLEFLVRTAYAIGPRAFRAADAGGDTVFRSSAL